MKLFAKLMLAVLVIALLLPFTILKDDSGNTLMSLADISLPEFSLPQLPKPGGGDEPVPALDGDLSGKDLFYKWYDNDGNVHFTSEPPADGVEYTVMGFDPNANVIQSVKLPAEDAASEDAAPAGQKSKEVGEIGNPYSKENIEKLFEDAKNIEKLLNQRLQQQDSTINQ